MDWVGYEWRVLFSDRERRAFDAYRQTSNERNCENIGSAECSLALFFSKQMNYMRYFARSLCLSLLVVGIFKR